MKPGTKVRLKDYATKDDGGLSREEGEQQFAKLHARLIELDELLYADARHAVLLVFQGMDTSGKDSTVRAVFSGVNPSGNHVAGFKQPSSIERAHDFLWRIHAQTPPRGSMTIFNRSHYEDVLVVRVDRLVPEARWRTRYEHINHFEKLLHDEGTTIRKFYLHISPEFQKQRLEKRLADPRKHWKFDPADLTVRAKWREYAEAYEDVLRKCSTDHAPWYIVPAERRWFRDLLVARVLVETLEGLNLRYPEATIDAGKVAIPDVG
jgi:PPK2 family polyphosphate:nucleotide phosphotransferase